MFIFKGMLSDLVAFLDPNNKFHGGDNSAISMNAIIYLLGP